jgi:hypothetical protein
VVPVVITNSQADWFDAQRYTFDAIKNLIGHKLLRRNTAECAPGGAKRDTADCHPIKETNWLLQGKQWAALEVTSLEVMNIETWADFLDAQVRTSQLASSCRCRSDLSQQQTPV